MAKTKEEQLALWDAMIEAKHIGSQVEMESALQRAVISELPSMYQTGRMWTPTLLETRSHFIPYVMARYGSDTAGMVGRSLSEFMVMVSRTPSISERQRSAMNFSQALVNSPLSERDKFLLMVMALNYAGSPRIVWEAEFTDSGVLMVRSRFRV